MSEIIKGCLGFKGEKGAPGEIQIADIVDNLNSDSATKPLSAKQGKILANAKADKTELIAEATTRQSADNNLQSQINGLASGSPKGSYATVSDLTTDNPATGVYVIQADGHIYSWTKDGESAIDLGVYQTTAPTSGYEELVNQYGYKIDTQFSTAATIYTKIYLKAGETYHIRNFDDGVSVNVFIQGHSSNYLSTTEDVQAFTPENTGYLTIYKSNYQSGDKVKVYIENGLLKEENERKSFEVMNKLILSKSIELMSSYAKTIGKFINGTPAIDNASKGRIYFYELSAGKYVISGRGNRSVCIATVNNSNEPVKKIASFGNGTDMIYNTLFLEFEETTKIGVSIWADTNLKDCIPLVLKVNDDSLIDKVVFNPLSFTRLFPAVEPLTIEEGFLKTDGTSQINNNWKHFIVNCEPNTSYTIKNAAYYLVQFLSDGTFSNTKISDDDSEYVFTTEPNCIKFGTSFRSDENYYWLTNQQDDLVTNFKQEEKTKFYERHLDDEPFIVYNEVIVGDDDKKQNNDTKLNFLKYPLTPTWGGEYLASWYNKLFAGTPVVIGFEGDSITQGEDGGYREKCLEKIMKIGGYTSNDFTIINNGLGGRSTNEWVGTGNYYYQESDATNYPNGILDRGMQNTPDLLICGHGINDSTAGAEEDNLSITERLEMFEANYREALDRIRGNTAVNGRPAYNRSSEELAIVLCMPINGNPSNTLKGKCREHNNWHIYIRPILQKLCREYQCAFCDFDMMTYDLKWSPNNIWGSTTQPPAYLHPNKAFNLYYASILQQLVLPIGLWKVE